MQVKKMAAGRRGMFISSKLGQNLSEMDVRRFERIKKVIWDQLLATKVARRRLEETEIIIIGLISLFCCFPFCVFRSLPR